MDLIETPFSTPVCIPPMRHHDLADRYDSARAAILGIADPSFTETPPPGQLVESAFLLRGGDLRLANFSEMPNGSIILTDVFSDHFTGVEAMTTRVESALEDQDIPGFVTLKEYMLAGVYAIADTLSFTHELSFSRAALWPPSLKDPMDFYAQMMTEAIPADSPLPDGLGLHIGYEVSGQLLTFEVWRHQLDLVDLFGTQELWVEPHTVTAECLGLSVAYDIRHLGRS